jgi:O-antigen/teichoic acid export membrane protein
VTDDGRRRGGSLARGGAVLGIAAILANGLGYGFTVVLARGFGAAEYGALGALLGAGLIGAIPAGGLQYVLARRTAARDLGTHRNERAGLLLAVGVGAVLALLVVALAPAAAAFFHLESVWPAVWLGVMLLPYTISGALLGSLLGHERYVVFGAAQVLMAFGRFTAGVFAGLAGFSVTGAIGSVAVATAVTCSLVYLLSGPRSWWSTDAVRAGALLGDLARACSAIAGIAVLSNLDLLLARHYLPRDVSGAYALASLFAKVCLWGGQFVPMVVFARMSRDGRDRRLLLRAGLVCVAVGAAVVLAAAVAAGPIIRTIAGADQGYAAAVPLAVPFALLGTLWALVQLALLAAVAAGDSRPGRLLWAIVAVEAAVIAFGPHSSAGPILATCLGAAGALVIGGIVLDLRHPPAEPGRTAEPDRVVGTGREDRPELLGPAPVSATVD